MHTTRLIVAPALLALAFPASTQSPAALAVDLPTVLSGPTLIPELSASSLGVLGIKSISVTPSFSSPGKYAVYATVNASNIFSAQNQRGVWDGTGGVVVGGSNQNAINCRVYHPPIVPPGGTSSAVSDTNWTNSGGTGYDGLPIYEDLPTDTEFALAPSVIVTSGESFPQLAVDNDGTLSGNSSTTWLYFRSPPGPLGGIIEAVMLDLGVPMGPGFGHAFVATRRQVFTTAPVGNFIAWYSYAPVLNLGSDVGAGIALALTIDAGVFGRSLYWNGFGLTDGGVTPEPYPYDAPGFVTWDASTFAGTTFVVRSPVGSPVGSEVVRIDTAALASRTVSSALGGPVKFPLMLPFDMSLANLVAVLLVGPPIPPISLTPFGFVGDLGIAIGSPAVVAFPNSTGLEWNFNVPVGIGAGTISAQALVFDLQKKTGFASNRALLVIQ